MNNLQTIKIYISHAGNSVIRFIRYNEQSAYPLDTIIHNYTIESPDIESHEKSLNRKLRLERIIRKLLVSKHGIDISLDSFFVKDNIASNGIVITIFVHKFIVGKVY